MTPTSAVARPRLLTPVFVLVTGANFFYFLCVGALIPTLPLFVRGPLDAGDIAVGVTTGVFSLAAVVLRPWSGRVGDERGRRVIIIAGAILVTVSVAAYTLATTLLPLLLLRLVSGAGEALFYVGVASAINDISPEERRGEALSYFSLALYGGLAVGPLLGEGVLGPGRFTLAWTVAAGCALVATLLALRIPDTRPREEQGPITTRHRLLHPAGLIPGSVLATSVWGLAGFTAFVPLYSRELGMSGSSAVFALYSSIILGIRSIGARIPDRFGVRRTARTAATCSFLGLGTIALWATPTGLFVGTVAFAFGQSLMFPALMAIAVRGAPAAQRGAVVGTFTAFFDLGFGLGAVSLGAVAAAVGYRGLFAAAATVALAGLLLLFFYAHRARSVSPAPPPEAAPVEGA